MVVGVVVIAVSGFVNIVGVLLSPLVVAAAVVITVVVVSDIVVVALIFVVTVVVVDTIVVVAVFCHHCSRRRCCLFHPSVFVGENPSEPQHPGVCSSSIYFEEAKSLVSLILSSRPTYWPRYVSLKYVFSFFLHLCRLRKKCFEMFSRSKSYFC